MFGERVVFFIEGYELIEYNDKFEESEHIAHSQSVKCRAKYLRKRYKTDKKHNLNCKMSSMIRRELRVEKNNRKWIDLVEYTHNDLIKHFKKTMPQGYTWQDFLEGKLHIDHIIPKSAFNYTKPEHYDFKRCWALENLRLLPAKENISKHDKLLKPFQPALLF